MTRLIVNNFDIQYKWNSNRKTKCPAASAFPTQNGLTCPLAPTSCPTVAKQLHHPLQGSDIMKYGKCVPGEIWKHDRITPHTRMFAFWFDREQVNFSCQQRGFSVSPKWHIFNQHPRILNFRFFSYILCLPLARIYLITGFLRNS